MNQFGIQYNMWKYNETPCIAILKMTFFKNGEQEGKQVLSGGWHQCVWEI
jgi:hypothetical protein